MNEVVALLDGVGDLTAVGVAVDLHDEATETEDRCTAVLLRIELLHRTLEGALDECTADEGDGGGLDGTHDLTEKHLTDALIHLEDAVTDEGVTYDDVAGTEGNLTCLTGTDEVDVLHFLEERHRLLHEGIALLLLGTDIHESDRRILDTADLLHIDGAHLCVLDQPLRLGVNIGTTVEQQGHALAGRNQCTERRTRHTLRAADDELTAGENRTTRARGNEGIGMALLHEMKRLHDAGILLTTDRKHRCLMQGNHLRRITDLDTLCELRLGHTSRLRALLQLLLQKPLRTEKKKLRIFRSCKGTKRTIHDRGRRVITTHTVDCYSDHNTPF